MADTKELTTEEEVSTTQTLPVLPLRGTIVYPFLVVPLMIQEAAHARLVDEALMRGSRIGLFLQKDPKKEDVTSDDLYEIGPTVARSVREWFDDPANRRLVERNPRLGQRIG